MLVKPTTAISWFAPAFLYRPRQRGELQRPRVDPWSVVLVVIPLLAALLWTRHADAIKAANPMMEWLTSRNFEEWNFGRLDQRFELRTWDVLGGRFPLLVGLGVVLLPLAVLAAARSRQRLF